MDPGKEYPLRERTGNYTTKAGTAKGSTSDILARLDRLEANVQRFEEDIKKLKKCHAVMTRSMIGKDLDSSVNTRKRRLSTPDETAARKRVP